jgi:hypothetical protein
MTHFVVIAGPEPNPKHRRLTPKALREAVYTGDKYELLPVANETMDEILADEKKAGVVGYPFYRSPDGRLWPEPHADIVIEESECSLPS